MSEVSKFITVLQAKRIDSLKNARQKNNLPLFTGEAIAYRESIDLANKMLMTDEPTLDTNQQAVLEWLRAYGDKDGGSNPIPTVWYLLNLLVKGRCGEQVKNSFLKLNRKQQAQVLKSFAEWVLEQEEENNER